MSQRRWLWLIALSALAVTVPVGFIWPVSEEACFAQGGWLEHSHRTCFWPDGSRATRPTQYAYFGVLGMVILFGGLAAGGIRVAQAVRRNLRRAA